MCWMEEIIIFPKLFLFFLFGLFIVNVYDVGLREKKKEDIKNKKENCV
jgi:hypothetical protein